MQSPLLGFNNNVKHRGRRFHIQTEDSGVKHPHVITHLFMDGGRILKSIKTSYAEHIGSDRLSEVVRNLMKEQHKTMFIALRDGQFDHVIGGENGTLGSNSMLPGEATILPGGASILPGTTSIAPGVPARSTSPSAASAPSAAPIPIALPRPPGQSPVAMTPPPPADPTMTARSVGRREAPELFAGQAAEATAVNLVDPDPSQLTLTPKKEKPSSGRYAASRPAALFTSGRNPESGGSIFGDDLISEKSLDEVILSYLSEDLETSSKK